MTPVHLHKLEWALPELKKDHTLCYNIGNTFVFLVILNIECIAFKPLLILHVNTSCEIT